MVLKVTEWTKMYSITFQIKMQAIILFLDCNFVFIDYGN